MPKEGREVKHNRGSGLEKSRGSNEAHCTAGIQILSLLSAAQILNGSHSHAAPALLLVIVWLVAHGDLLFLDSAPQLAIRVLAMSSVYNVGVVLEDTPYRMEQTVYRQMAEGREGLLCRSNRIWA